MPENNILITIIMLISTAVFVVAVFKRLHLSPVLGYLVSGAIIGDNGLQVIKYNQTHFLAEFGVVFLLFAIGLELSMERLKSMRRYVFGLGSMQVILTSAVIITVVMLMTHNTTTAIVIACGLALSSTAIVMQVISDTNNQSTQIGRIALAILLLQDFVVVPLLVIIPILSTGEVNSIYSVLGFSLTKAVIALVGIFIVGRLLFRPIFAFIGGDYGENSELQVAITLLIVLAASWMTEHFGLSLALGAFISGVMVAETSFRNKAEESIHPFKSLLLGLFFMSVGMKIDVMEIYMNITNILFLCLSLIFLKAFIISLLCMLFGFNRGISIHAGLLLSQGGEFAFILFGMGKEYGVFDEPTANILLLVVTCSMALTPLLASIGQRFSERVERKLGKAPNQIIEQGTSDIENHVIIAGFGEVGSTVAKVLEAEGVNYVVLDANEEVVNIGLSENIPIFKGDASRIKTLNAIGADRALAIIITINNQITIRKISKIVSSNFNNLEIATRAKNLDESLELYKNGVSAIIPENYETGLQLGSVALRSAGINENEINRIKIQFRSGNYVLTKQEDGLLENEDNE